MLINLLGILGTTLGIQMYIPQIFKVLKTKKVDDLSKTYFTIIMIGMLGWMFFTGMTRDFLPWLVNFVISLMMFVIIWFLYGQRKSIPVIVAFFIGQITSLIFLIFIKVNISDLTSSILIIIGGLGTGTGLYFQWYKVMQTKRTRDLSVIMLFLIVFNQSIWTTRWVFILEETFQVSKVLCIVFSGMPIIPGVALIACKQFIKEPKPY